MCKHIVVIRAIFPEVSNSRSDLQDHSRSLVLVPFDRPHMISYLSSIVIMPLSCAVSEILSLICQNLKRSRDPVCTLFGAILSCVATTYCDQSSYEIWIAFNRPKDIIASQYENGSRDPHHAHLGAICHPYANKHFIWPSCTKIEDIWKFRRYEGGPKTYLGWFGVLGGSRSSAISSFNRAHFLLAFHRNYASIFYRFRVVVTYMLKIANFSAPLVSIEAPLVVTPLEL